MPSKKYYRKNREKYIEESIEWQKNHPEKVRKAREERHKNNPEKMKLISRRASIKFNHGLSYEDWLKIWEGQDGKCAICGKLFIEFSDAYTDHDHKTDEIRGLLCSKCNFAIGLLDDDPKLLKKAMEYLKKMIKKE